MKPNKKTSIFNYLKKRNVKRFLMFFTIAFIFLIFSKLSNDYKRSIKLNVSLVNIADEVLLQNDSLNNINAFIEAKGFVLLPFIFKDTKDIILNVETDVIPTPEHYIFDIQKHKFLIENQLGGSYKVLSLKPDTLLLHYSKMATKRVPVKLNHNINYTTGYDIKGDFQLNVDSVKIVGSATQIDKIKTLSTEKLELNNINKAISSNVKIDISAYNNIEVFPKSINISGVVTRFTEGIVEVPITIVNIPKTITINYFPKTVMVSYYVDLERYNTITSKDFVVECDYSKLKDNQKHLIPKITKKPEFIKRINVKQKRIDFIKL